MDTILPKIPKMPRVAVRTPSMKNLTLIFFHRPAMEKDEGEIRAFMSKDSIRMGLNCRGVYVYKRTVTMNFNSLL